MKYLIEYGGSKCERGGFTVNVRVNGKYLYTLARNRKSLRGAVTEAKRIAEGIAAGKSEVEIKPL